MKFEVGMDRGLYLAIAGVILMVAASIYVNVGSATVSEVVVDSSFSLQPGSAVQFQVNAGSGGELILRLVGPSDREIVVSLRSSDGTKIFEDTVSGVYTTQIPLPQGGAPYKLLIYYHVGGGPYEGAIVAVATYSEPVYQSTAACTPLLAATVGALLAGIGIGSRASTIIGVGESGKAPANTGES